MKQSSDITTIKKKTPTKPDVLKAKWPIPMIRDERTGHMRHCLDGALKDKFIELYPTHSNPQLMKLFGISHSTLQRLKKKLGLKKNNVLFKKMARKRVKVMKENGYFESMKGKPLCDKAIEKVKEMRRNGFCPIKYIKENNPKRYKAICEKISKTKTELYRKEAIRAIYGLERKTKIRISINPLTKKASSSKYYLIKKRNYFAVEDDSWVVCYDSNTRRSERLEATAIKNGLKIEQGED